MTRVRGDDELMELLGMMGGGAPNEGKVAAASKEEEGVRCAKGNRRQSMLTVPREIS